MEYEWKSSLWMHFKELHNDQEYYWPTTYRAGGSYSVKYYYLLIKNSKFYKICLKVCNLHSTVNDWSQLFPLSFFLIFQFTVVTNNTSPGKVFSLSWNIAIYRYYSFPLGIIKKIQNFIEKVAVVTSRPTPKSPHGKRKHFQVVYSIMQKHGTPKQTTKEKF